MLITKNRLFIGLILYGLITAFLVFGNIEQFHLRSITSFLFLTTVPGLLIMLILKIRKTDFWEYLSYTVGLSLSTLILIGWLLNITLPLLGITERPLSLPVISSGITFFLLGLGILAYKRSVNSLLRIQLPRYNLLNLVFFLTPLLFLILSILGAVTLNNGGANYLTIMMLGGIAVYSLLIVLLRNKLNSNVFPFSIIINSLSLLLMYSLRSWFISGWDVSRELYVFRLTSDNELWSIKSYLDSFNTCLSISILPTIYNKITFINPSLVFKLLFQVIFAFHSLTIYLILRKYVKSITSFIASILYFGGVYYNSTFPTLIRQEVAFSFFGLMLLVLFSKNINTWYKNFLFLVFGYSMVVSHYSTSYIALAILISVYFLSYIYKFFIKFLHVKRLKYKKRLQLYLTGRLVVVLLAFQIIWVAQFSSLNKGLLDTIKYTYQNIGKIFTEDLKDASIKNALFRNMYVEGYSNQELLDYINEKKVILTPSNPYPYEQTKTYTPLISNSQTIVSSSPNIGQGIFCFYQVVKYSIILSIIIGLIIFFFKRYSGIDIEYVYASFSSIILLLLIMLLPYVSKVYNFERLFQQSLMFLALPSILGFQKILKKFGSLSIVFPTVIYLFYSLINMGFLIDISGGVPTLNLYNTGFAYDAFYTHENEIYSLTWLKNNNQAGTIYMDPQSELKYYAYGKPNINIKDKVIPIFMTKSSYVYSSYTNTVKKINFLDVREKYNKGVISFNYPTIFLNDSKNKIYSNGMSEVYR